jgi:beta-N-acetylhexosaminidase
VIISVYFFKKSDFSNSFLLKNSQRKRDVLDEEKLKSEIGQMILVGFRGTNISEDSPIAQKIKSLNLGGVILFDYDNPSKSFPRNIENPTQVAKLINSLQSFAQTPLFIAVDAEGGTINRLKAKYGFVDFPSAQKLGTQDNLLKTKQVAEDLGKELHQLGFNLDFAPVVDVNINTQNPIIGRLERSFSSDPQKVIDQALVFIEGLHKNNIISVIKHFPGHGSSQNDSHLDMADVTKTYQEKELLPFQKIIQNNQADMVMTAHIVNKNIDSLYPATLSSIFLHDILRDQLGFYGVIISDDMQMGAIVKNYGFKDALIRSINAGCNLLIFSNNGDIYNENVASDASDIIFQAVKDGKIPKEKIDESFSKILEIKKKFKIINYNI